MIIEEWIKEKHNNLIYFKNSLYIVEISTICESFRWLAYFIPRLYQIIPPHTQNILSTVEGSK